MTITSTTLTTAEESATDPAEREGKFRGVEQLRSQVVDRIFQRYRTRLLRHIARLMSSVDDAEEIVQETYARLLEVPKLDSVESRIRAYAFRIATNLAYDRFRARRALGRQVEFDDAGLADDAQDPLHIAGIDQCLDIIKRALLELDARARQVYLLRTAEQLSYPDIAMRLGVSTRTVEREMRKVIEFCQQKLQSEDWE